MNAMSNEPDVTLPRRRLLSWVVGLAGALAAAIASVPVIWAIIFPVRARTVREQEGFIDVAGFGDLQADAPMKAAVLATRYDAWTRVDGVELGAVWLVRKGDGSLTAFSSICPHLGCSVDWISDTKTFNCPCHGSVFGIEGNVTAGPSPRPLDRLDVRLAAGRVLVRYQRFVVGTPDRRTA